VPKGESRSLFIVQDVYSGWYEAADLLNVSRPYLIKKIEAGELPHHKVGRHRRIHFNDLMVYKERSDREAAAAFDEMVAISQELGFYD
jgi:excisionase family DNA binding protein